MAVSDDAGSDTAADTTDPHPAGPLARRPVTVALAALGLVGAVRVAEVFLGRPWTTGVLVWSTLAATVAGVALLVFHAGRPRSLLPRRQTTTRAVLAGGIAVLGVQAAAHGLQVVATGLAGLDGAIVVEALNPVTNTDTALGLYLLVGVGLTAVGEELLFRGALLRAFERRGSFHVANVCQAGLFGIWHMAWPLAFLAGPYESPVALPVLAVGTVCVTGLVGAVFGLLVRASGTLWTAVLAHVVHNGVAVFVHVRAAGIDRSQALSPGLVLGYAVVAWLVWRHWQGPLFEDL